MEGAPVIGGTEMESKTSSTSASLASNVSTAGALVGVRRGSAGAVGTENGVWSSGDVNTIGDGASAALVVPVVPLGIGESASEGCATSLTDDDVFPRRGTVAGGGAVECGIGFKTDIPSVPNTLFVLRLFT